MKNCWLKNKLFASGIAILFVIFGLSLATPAQSVSLKTTFPKLANYYLMPEISLSQARELSRWDAVIIGVENQYNNPEIFEVMRQLNPGIVILAYIASEEVPLNYFEFTDPTHPYYKLSQGISERWWLRDHEGDYQNYWPGTRMINVTLSAPTVRGKRWATYLPEFMHNEVMSTGLWDGIFYDNMWNGISWLNDGDLDINNDGQKESAAALDSAWYEGMSAMLEYSRELEGKDVIIVGNGGGQYFEFINGRLMEEFPSAQDGGWGGAMEKYFSAQRKSQIPTVIIINGVSSTGRSDDYRRLRYSLTSTLLGNGLASFDFGPLRHADLWWYDEYNAFLGRALGEAINLSKPGTSISTPGVWRREFLNGMVLVNSTNGFQRVELGAGYEKIKGSQDPKVNDGSIVNVVNLAPHDGLIVLKRQYDLEQGQYVNGALAKAFSADGRVKRQGFFTYSSAYAGGVVIVRDDLDNDGDSETLVGRNTEIQIYNSQGYLVKEFEPYGPNYNRGLTIATGDLDGDRKKEIVTGTKQGAGPHVRIFSRSGKLINPGFFAYHKNFRGGVNVALGDLNGDKKCEIITGAGPGGGPHVRVFNRFGRALSGFFAYDNNFRGGVSVAAANVAGDRKVEIITGAGPGGGPHVRIFNAAGKAVKPGFFGFEASWRQGIRVATSDLDRDGKQEIIVSSLLAY